MKVQKLNHAAVAVLAVFYMVFEALWYGLFSDPWVRLSKLTADELKTGGSPLLYLVALATALAGLYGLAWFFKLVKVQTAKKGALYGAGVSLVFVFLEILTKDLFSMRPLMLSLINGGSEVIFFAVAGAVLGGWKKFKPEQPAEGQ